MAPGVVGSIPIGHPNKRICVTRAPVAQLDRALASEAKGRRFDSCRAHHLESRARLFGSLALFASFALFAREVFASSLAGR